MRKRRAVAVFIGGVAVLLLLAGAMPRLVQESFSTPADNSAQGTETQKSAKNKQIALEALESLAIKGRASKTGYTRAQFGDGWGKLNGCSTREIILNRDLSNVKLEDDCKITSGTLDDPYTGKIIYFTKDDASAVQIDHVVAISDTWQKGAQDLTKEMRTRLANDPLELLAVDGPANQQKGDGDAATWLPKNKAFRCEYIARQVAVKIKYMLWVTTEEFAAMKSILKGCPNEVLP